MAFKVKTVFWRAIYSLVASRLPNRPRWLRRIRAYSAGRCCAYVDPTANINRGARINSKVVIEAHAGVGEGTILSGEVHLGKHVTMGPYCHFITGDHPVPADYKEFRDMHPVHKRIVVGEGAFIGARVTVLPGVNIGRGAAVGAGSVVAKNVPAGAVAVGNPARVVRQRLV